MADHIRKQLRDKLQEILLGLDTTDQHAFINRPRAYPLAETELPGLVIKLHDESAEPQTLKRPGRRIERVLNAVIDCYAKGDEAEDKLDQMQLEIELAMVEDVTLDGLAKDSYFAQADDDDDAEGDQPCWMRSLTFRIICHTADNAPDVAI